MTMRKASFKTLSMKRVSELGYQTGAQYPDVEYTRDRAALALFLAPAPHLESTSCLSSVTHKDSLLHNATRW